MSGTNRSHQTRLKQWRIVCGARQPSAAQCCIVLVLWATMGTISLWLNYGSATVFQMGGDILEGLDISKGGGRGAEADIPKVGAPSVDGDEKGSGLDQLSDILSVATGFRQFLYVPSGGVAAHFVKHHLIVTSNPSLTSAYNSNCRSTVKQPETSKSKDLWATERHPLAEIMWLCGVDSRRPFPLLNFGIPPSLQRKVELNTKKGHTSNLTKSQLKWRERGRESGGQSEEEEKLHQDGGKGLGKWTKEGREEAEEKGGRRKGRREGKRWGKADNERCTYQQVPTAVLVTLRSGEKEEDGPFMHAGRCGQRREEMRSTEERKSMNKPKQRKGKEGRKERASSAISKGSVTRVPKPINPFLDPRPGQRSDRAYDNRGALMRIASTNNNDIAGPDCSVSRCIKTTQWHDAPDAAYDVAVAGGAHVVDYAVIYGRKRLGSGEWRTGNGEEDANQARVPPACGKMRGGKTRACVAVGTGRRCRRGARTLKRGRAEDELIRLGRPLALGGSGSLNEDKPREEEGRYSPDSSIGRVRGGEGGGRLAPVAHRVQEGGECEGGRASEWRGKRPAGRNRRRRQRRNQDARALAFRELAHRRYGWARYAPEVKWDGKRISIGMASLPEQHWELGTR
ncbi:hypothetical protein B0H13DRAFT_2536132 [Mycena leptocephala]|nr:hypothetical protein B0H13DRAFT_2536132 [Mycena leptocephala]